MDRRQVDHVEAHPGDRLQPAHGGAQRAALGLAAPHRVCLHALRAGEELIPGPVQRPRPVHHQRVRGRPGEQFAQRRRVKDRGDLLVVGGGQPVPGGDARVAQPRRHGRERRPVRDRPQRRPGRAVEQDGPLGQHQFHVLAARDLDAGVVAPVADRVAPGLHVEPPPALGIRRDLGRVAVQAGEYLPHPGRRLALAVRAAQHHAGPGYLVSLTEHGRADLEGFPDDGLGRPAPAVEHGLHVTDHYPTDHPRTLPSLTRMHSCRPARGAPARRIR